MDPKSKALLSKAAVDLVLFAISIIATVMLFRYLATNSVVDQMENMKIADAKRLFGPAWKEAMKLDDDN